jgi:hypothetical protein
LCCPNVPLKSRCPPPGFITWQVPHEPSPYTAVRFVRYWGRAKDSGAPARITDVNKSNTITGFLFIYCISFFSFFDIVAFHAAERINRFLTGNPKRYLFTIP